MPLRALIQKEFRLLVRDRLSAVLLLVMPFLFILVLGLLLGEGFGQKPDNRLRISLVSGAIEYEALLAGVNGPASLLPGDSIVYFDGSEIVVRDPAGTERRAAAGMAPAYLEQMGKDWIAIREAGPGRLFALRIRQQSLDLYQLPEVSQ